MANARKLRGRLLRFCTEKVRVAGKPLGWDPIHTPQHVTAVLSLGTPTRRRRCLAHDDSLKQKVDVQRVS